MPSVLSREVECYRRLLPSLLTTAEGRFVLIRGDELVGLFEKEAEALRAGYESCGPVPFLVCRVDRHPERCVLRGPSPGA